MRLVLAFAAVLLAFVSARAEELNGTAASDRLDQLFAMLRQSDGGADGRSAEALIWQLWMEGGTTAEDDILQKAATAMGSGSFPVSESILNSLIAQTDTFPEAYNKRATLYFLMGKYEASLADIASTLNLEPRHFGALSGKGMVLQKLGRNAEALVAYREALAVNPHLSGAKLAIQQLELLVPEL